jgi:flagellar assembly factor FliW
MSPAVDLVTQEVETRFGAFAVDPSSVVRFPHGLPGFEACRRFVVLSDARLAPFTGLHGVDAPGPTFLALDPRCVIADYGVALGSRERARLDTDGAEPLLWLAIVRVDGHALTANLRAPVVINPRCMIGLQIVGADTSYPDAYPLGTI